jgi:LPXTG-motif cell wall-anchored protein
MKRIIGALVLAAGLFAAAPALSAQASADTGPSVPSCDQGPHTVSTHLVNRSDGGHGNGTWAVDDIQRVVTFTRVQAKTPQVADDEWSYHAQVKDTGTFVTNGGATLSPNKGAPLVAGVHGKLTGSFSADFNSTACFANFDPKLPATVSGDNPKTSQWIVLAWGGKMDLTTPDATQQYEWQYDTCSESWLDAYNNKDGTAAGAGDITGLPCASPTPTNSASAPAPTPSASSGAGGAAGGAQAPTPGLPVTGSGAVYWAAGAGAVLVGGGLFLVARRRRVKFSS